MKFIQNRPNKDTYTHYYRKKMNSRENQMFNLLLIRYIFPRKKLQSKKRKEKEFCGLNLG